jgi:hypothetical protein
MFVTPRNSAGAWYFFHKGNLAALGRRMADLKEIGARFVRFWVPWSEVEPEEGRFDFAYVNDAIAAIAATGLRLDITLCSLMAPAWFWAKYPDARPMNERGEPVYKPSPNSVASASISLWHPELRPRTEAFINRAFAACLDRWAPVVLFVRVSMGRFNEPNYPDPKHFWCYDRWAQADFRARMDAKYAGDVSALNGAWGTRAGGFEKIEVPEPRGFKTSTPAARADFIEWYRDAKDGFVVWAIGALQSRLKPWQRVVVFPAGSDDADAHMEPFVQKGVVRPSLRHMARNSWLIKICREMDLCAQYAGLGLNVDEGFLRRLADLCRGAGVPLYGQIAGLRCKSDGAANCPEAIAKQVVEFKLHGLAWNKDEDVFCGPVQPNEKFRELKRAFDLIARRHGEAGPDPAISSVKHLPSPDGARIEWETDRECDGFVLYGTRRGLPERASAREPAPGRTHAVALSGLRPGALHYYRVSSMDRLGRAACGPERTFVPGR